MGELRISVSYWMTLVAVVRISVPPPSQQMLQVLVQYQATLPAEVLDSVVQPSQRML